MIEATTRCNKVMDNVDDKIDNKDNFPVSAHNDSDSDHEDHEDHQVLELDGDSDSLDEGVGDISSDGDHHDSPCFGEKNGMSNNNINSGDPAITKSDESYEKVSDLTENIDPQTYLHTTYNSPTTSPVKERIPSRF